MWREIVCWGWVVIVVMLQLSHITLVAHTIYESHTSFLTHVMLVRLVILF